MHVFLFNRLLIIFLFHVEIKLNSSCSFHAPIHHLQRCSWGSGDGTCQDSMGSSQGFGTGSSARQHPGLATVSPWLGVQLLHDSTANTVLMVFCVPPAWGMLASAGTQYANPFIVLPIYSFAVLQHIRAATKTVKPDVPKNQELGGKSSGDNKSHSFYGNTNDQLSSFSDHLDTAFWHIFPEIEMHFNVPYEIFLGI